MDHVFSAWMDELREIVDGLEEHEMRLICGLLFSTEQEAAERVLRRANNIIFSADNAAD
jgi:hypothetical protein